MRGAFARSLYHPECPRRHLLRLHQPHAGNRDAWLRCNRDGFRHRMPDGQARPPRRHGSDGVSHSQRLSRRRHEGASAGSKEHGVDRMRAGRRRKGQMAATRGIQADVLAQGRRRRARGGSRYRKGSARAGALGRAAAHALRSRTAAGSRAAASGARLQPVSPPPAPQPASHGAIRFSSVFGSRRR